jgi:hypothetical protein
MLSNELPAHLPEFIKEEIQALQELRTLVHSLRCLENADKVDPLQLQKVRKRIDCILGI